MTAKLLEQYASMYTPEGEAENGLNRNENTSDGPIIYTTLEKAIKDHLDDPFSQNKLDFIAKAYGCDPEALIKEAGLEPLLQAYREKRMVSAVKSHALLGDPYNMTDVIMSGVITQETGIPTAVLAVTYSDDQFVSSPEKIALFGTQRYFLGYNEKGKPLFSSVQIKPAGIRSYNEAGEQIITPIDNIDDAVGTSLTDIMVKIVEPIDPRGTKSVITNSEVKEHYIESALGISWEQIVNHPSLGADAGTGNVSLSNLHRVLFDETINRLRNQGILPSEEEMPIIYGELGKISKTMLEHATYVQETNQFLGFEGSAAEILTDTLCIQPSTVQKVDDFLDSNDEALLAELENEIPIHSSAVTAEALEQIKQLGEEKLQRVLSFIMNKRNLTFHEKSGLLANGEHADPASYYPLFQALLCHDYCELDGSDVDHYFSRKLQRAQALQSAHGLPITIIRTPADEIKTLDNTSLIKPFVATRVHPTGRYFDITAANGYVSQNIILPLRQQELSGNKMSKPEQTALEGRLQEIKRGELEKILLAVRESVQNGTDSEWARITEAVTTDEAMTWYINTLMSSTNNLDYSKIKV